jgi:TP901 family phage tail tape measure protein
MAGKPINIRIIGDDSQLRKTLSKAANRVEGFGKNVAKAGVAAGAAFAGVATAIGTATVTAFADFDKGMREVMTLLPGAAEGTFKDLSKQVQDFSKEFGVLPDEVIPSLYQALSAGVPQENVFEFLEVAQQAALGGVTDLETAVDGISSVVNAYGSDVLGAGEASDLMFTAVRLGKTTFDEMSSSMFQVAPIASALGINFADVTTSIANLTAQGTPTSVAATQLKAAFSELGKEGTIADKAFRDLAGMGLTQFLETEGNMASALNIIATGADDAGISVLDMFGSIEAGQAVLGLTAGGIDAYTTTLGEMSESTGATETAFDTMDQGIGRTFDKIKATLNVFMIQVGEKLAPVVERGIEIIGDAFDWVKPKVIDLKDKIIEFTETKEFKKFKEIVVDAFQKIGKWLSKAFNAVKEWIKENPKAFFAGVATIVGGVLLAAVWGLVGAMAALLSPVLLVMAAIAALVAGVIYAWENWDVFRETILGAVDYMTNTAWPAIQAFWEDIVAAAKIFADFFMEYLWPVFEAVWERVIGQVQAVWDFFTGFVELVKGIFAGDMSQIMDALGDMFGAAFDFIIEKFILFPARMIAAIFPLIADIGKFGLDIGVSLLKGLGDWYLNSFIPWWLDLPSKLWGVIKGLAAKLGNIGADIGGYIIDAMIGAISGIGDAISSAADWVANFGKEVVNGIIGFINTAIGTLNDLLEFTIPGPFGTSFTVDPPDIPHIPKLAEGGITTGPQLAMIGEGNEPEMVLPLSKAGEMGFGGGGGINLTVNAGMGTDGLAVGNQIISILKQWERTNGSIPLNVSSN